MLRMIHIERLSFRKLESLLFLATFSPLPAQGQKYLDSSLPIPARVDDLVDFRREGVTDAE